ncbi:MAG: 30S ribosomal protein S3 [Zavarzinella sp.]
MGQKVRPTGFRTGVMIGWQSSWYANKRDFSDLLIEDRKIRGFIKKLLKKKRPQISRIKIERTREKVIVTIFSGKIGVIIGKKGADVEKLTELLQRLIRRVVEVKTVDVTRPETDAQIISEDLAEQLEKRASFRRIMKQAMQKAMDAGAKGIKLQLSGRLGGAEMARCEKSLTGSVPLSTLRAKVEYGFSEANTPQGNIGIKVWVNNGDYLTEEILDPNAGAPPRSRRRRRVRGDGSDQAAPQ